jgi:beta-lactam-binding protein with PASTA domain
MMKSKRFSRLVGAGLLAVCLAVAGCPVGDYTGEYYVDVAETFDDCRIGVDITWDETSMRPFGEILSQDPGPGSRLAPFFGDLALTVSHGEGEAVPNVVGMTESAASAAITKAGLKVGAVTQAYSATVAVGLVISQDPIASTPTSDRVVAGTAVALTISKGPAPPSADVPDVVGQTQEAASAAITQVGLTTGTITLIYSETVAAGLVISQDPAAGESVSPGSAVALTVSKGPRPTSAAVPDVVGETQADALEAIEATGLAAPHVLQQCSSTVSEGTVIAQNPPAGTVVDIADVVAISVSSGTCDEDAEVLMLPVAAGTFTMGNSGAGDDETNGSADESPAHQVTLSAYQIGKYEVTNEQFCAVLNWAYAQGHLKDFSGAAWTGVGDPYVGGDSVHGIIFSAASYIQFSNGTFTPKNATGQPNQTSYPTNKHPVMAVSWYGAAAFCNWLSEMNGLTPCYDMTTANWPLVVAPPTSGGYRLPTEAEWERAAAWDGTKHWIYGFTSDTLTGLSQANYDEGNPFGLTLEPYTSPVDWFNGTNENPNGGLTTTDSVSPVGAYGMSGNASEWCSDFYLETYYSGGAMTDPTGPDTAQQHRVARGGSYGSTSANCRSAYRAGRAPAESGKGFRVAGS